MTWRSLVFLSVAVASSLSPCGSTKKKKMNVLRSIAVPVSVYFGVVCAPLYGKGFPGAGGILDFETLEARGSPNEYLVAPKGACPNFEGTPLDDGSPRRREAPVYPLPVDDLRRAFDSMLRKRYAIDRFAKPTLSSERTRQYVYVERTPLLRFPDVINVQFLPVDDQTSTMILHSGSVFGYSDLGKNKQRVTEMLADLTNLPRYIKNRAVPV